jgi:broad specificity phosphatase PhoE
MNRLLRLFVTRHGGTVLNTQRKLQGWKDSDLTENGMEKGDIGVRPSVR